MFGIMVEKGSEFPEGDERRYFKYRVVFQGNHVKDQNWEVAMFSETASTPATLEASRIAVEGLKSLGLMRGDTESAVQNGAHALFFPHGLGHMLGLDVHDMEGLGEDLVGYESGSDRSDQFGLAYLRLSKELKSGFVITVEPGIYFIPHLIEDWASSNKLADFIIYDEVKKYKGFGGIRIEDNVHITENGHEILGPNIPKTISEIESCMAGSA